MGETPTYDLPYPDLPELDNVPLDMEQLALAVENTVSFTDANVSGKQSVSQKGAANGYAPLDANAQVPDVNMPGRLKANAPQPPGNDCNNAVENGWYHINASQTVNAPLPMWGGLHVVNLDTSSVRQFAYVHASEDSYMRQKSGGTWSTWVKIWPIVVPSGVDYIGTWGAGTAYKKGDVVRHNSVDYLAVNDSTGQAPPAQIIIADSAWHIVGAAGEPAFLNGFGNWDGAQGVGRVPRFRKLSSGLVVVDGIVRYPGAITNNPAFTLPVGYRPSTNYGDVTFVVNATTAFGVINIFSDGRVCINPATINSWCYLDGIRFYAES